MLTTKISINDWMDAAIKGLDETATGALAMENVELLGQSSSQPENWGGSYIGLISPQISIQMGVLGSTDACQAMAKALFCMEPDEEDMLPADVADAIGEIANIIAGIMKTGMSEHDLNIQIGLPIFIEGNIRPTEEQNLLVADVKMGEVLAHLIILTSSDYS